MPWSRRLSPLQRAYRLGFLRGLNRARAELYSKTECWEDKLRELEEGYAALVSKLQREQAIREAVTERVMIPDRWLN